MDKFFTKIWNFHDFELLKPTFLYQYNTIMLTLYLENGLFNRNPSTRENFIKIAQWGCRYCIASEVMHIDFCLFRRPHYKSIEHCGRLRRLRNQQQELLHAPMQSLHNTARLNDAAADNDNDDNNWDFIVVVLCLVYTSFDAKICNVSALIFWIRVGLGTSWYWVRVDRHPNVAIKGSIITLSRLGNKQKESPCKQASQQPSRYYV